MSGIYIKGMEMPDRCFSCPMHDTDSCGISRGSYIEYREVDVDVAIDHRPDWCPLISVPEHGRLIDADEFIRQLSDGSVSNAIQSGIGYRMSKMPTIIPAEEGE